MRNAGNPVNGIDPSGLSTISETLNTLNLFNQLAVRTYTVLSNVAPVAIDLAKAWAVIIGGAGVALLVLEETNRDNQTSVRVVPNEAYDDKRNDLNQMRLQLQDAPGNTFGIPIVNVPESGVTVGQVGQAVLTLWALRRNLASWFPKEHDTALIKAMAGVTKKAKDSYPIGVFQGSSQVYSRQWNRNDPKGNKPVSRGYYRVDFENLRGHNLRNL